MGDDQQTAYVESAVRAFENALPAGGAATPISLSESGSAAQLPSEVWELYICAFLAPAALRQLRSTCSRLVAPARKACVRWSVARRLTSTGCTVCKAIWRESQLFLVRQARIAEVTTEFPIYPVCADCRQALLNWHSHTELSVAPLLPTTVFNTRFLVATGSVSLAPWAHGEASREWTLQYFVRTLSSAARSLAQGPSEATVQFFVEALRSAMMAAELLEVTSTASFPLETALEFACAGLALRQPVKRGALATRYLAEQWARSVTIYRSQAEQLRRAVNRPPAANIQLNRQHEAISALPRGKALARKVGGLPGLYQLQLALPCRNPYERGSERQELDFWCRIVATASENPAAALVVVVLAGSHHLFGFNSAEGQSPEILPENVLVVCQDENTSILRFQADATATDTAHAVVTAAELTASRGFRRVHFILTLGIEPKDAEEIPLDVGPDRRREMALAARAVIEDQGINSECTVIVNYYRGRRSARIAQARAKTCSQYHAALHTLPSLSTRPVTRLVRDSLNFNLAMADITETTRRIANIAFLSASADASKVERGIISVEKLCYWAQGNAPCFSWCSGLTSTLQIAVTLGEPQLPLLFLPAGAELPAQLFLETPDGTEPLDLVSGPPLTEEAVAWVIESLIVQIERECSVSGSFITVDKLEALAGLVSTACQEKEAGYHQLLRDTFLNHLAVGKRRFASGGSARFSSVGFRTPPNLSAEVLARAFWLRFTDASALATVTTFGEHLLASAAGKACLDHGPVCHSAVRTLTHHARSAASKASELAADPMAWLRLLEHPKSRDVCDWTDFARLLLLGRGASSGQFNLDEAWSEHCLVPLPDVAGDFECVIGYSRTMRLLGISHRALGSTLVPHHFVQWRCATCIPLVVNLILGFTQTGNVVVCERVHTGEWKLQGSPAHAISPAKLEEIPAVLAAADEILQIYPIGRSLWTYRSRTFRNWGAVQNGSLPSQRIPETFHLPSERLASLRKFNLSECTDDVKFLVGSIGGERMPHKPVRFLYKLLRDRLDRKRKRCEFAECATNETRPDNLGGITRRIQKLDITEDRRKRRRIHRRTLWKKDEVRSFREAQRAVAAISRQRHLARFESRRANSSDFAASHCQQDPRGPIERTVFLTGFRGTTERQEIVSAVQQLGHVRGLRTVGRKLQGNTKELVVHAFVEMESEQAACRVIEEAGKGNLRLGATQLIADWEHHRNPDFAPRRCGGGRGIPQQRKRKRRDHATTSL
eukprot:TRINITY_DN6576_c0_g1_i1.p1 TRINITY_DN6576_c0_g1~~TRINITY_DN6576_c0_g1_i1.p1  ORF type:complete len:1388 (-),score=168.19 TRINITY_DN6576_c0_g1_i1:35-3751(-)